MSLATVLPCLLLVLACGAYIFWPPKDGLQGPRKEKNRLDYLRERKEVVYDNLRDLNFEYRAGKFPEEDFNRQRDALETEAADILAEMDILSAQSG